jgi:VWFA-related protein
MYTHAKWVLIVVWAASLAAFPQTSTRVTLNVVAFDSHDQVVGDLTSQDFQVSDQGQPQRIVSFHRNGDPQVSPSNVPNALQVAPPVVILFDLLNDNLANRGQGTAEIIKALEHLQLSDSLYLYLLSSQGELKPVRGLPSAQEDNPPEKTPWTERIKPLLGAAINNAYGVRVNVLRLENGLGTLPAIETLWRGVKTIPGPEEPHMDDTRRAPFIRK